MNQNDIVADTIAADFGLVRPSGHRVCSFVRSINIDATGQRGEKFLARKMKDYEQLSRLGRLRGLRRLAEKALTHYALDVRFLSRSEPDVLFAEEQLSAYTPHSLSLFQEIRARVEAEYARLDPAEWWGETAVPFFTALFERYLTSGELIRPLRA